jgi:HEAT repeat protein
VARGAGAADAIDADIDALGTCDVLLPARCPQLERLVYLGERAVPGLTAALERGDEASQVRAARALGFIQAPPAVAALAGAIGPGRSEAVRGALLGALGLSGSALATQTLVTWLSDGSVSDRIAAAQGLGLLGMPFGVAALVTALGDVHPHVQKASAHALGLIGDPAAIDALVDLLAGPRVTWLVREAAIGALEKLSAEQAVPALLLQLAHPQFEVRRQAAQSLGALDRTYALPGLIAQLGDPQTVSTAATALGALGDKRAASVLLDWLEPGRVTDEQRSILFWAVGALKEPATLPRLAEMTHSQTERTVLLAAEAIARIGAPEGAASLAPLLDHASDEVRKLAAWALQTLTGQKLEGDREAWMGYLRGAGLTP